MLDDPNSEQELTELLKKAGEAHHAYEQEKLNGNTDKKWHLWYADFLLKNGIEKFFEEKIEKEDLAESLSMAGARFTKETPELTWQEYYAKFLIYDFT